MRTTLHSTVILVTLLFSQQISAQTSWTAQTSGVADTLYSVQFLDANNGFVGGYRGTVLKTTDGGTTWTDVSITSSWMVRDISFIDANTGWAALGDVNDGDNSGELWHTTDGGTTWSKQTYYSTRARLGISFIDTSTGWACGSRSGPMDIANTLDGGTTWTEQTDGAVFGWTYKVDAISATDIWSVGVTFFPNPSGLIIHSTDGGSSWALQSLGTISYTYDVEAVDANTIYVCGDAGYIVATTDGGTTWNGQTTGTTDILWRTSFSSTMTGLACGDNGTIIGTINGGANWNAETSGVSTTLNGIYMLDSTTAWAVGAGGTILKRALGSGIKEGLWLTPGVAVFPNPFRNQTTIKIENAGVRDSYTFSLFDALGRPVNQYIINGRQHMLNRDQLPRGIYHYSITGNNSLPVSGKVVIQ